MRSIVQPGRRRVDLLLGLLLLGLAALPRLSSFSQVSDGQGWLLSDGDSYYHLRRIEQTMARRGRVPMFDPDLSYPEGQRLQWQQQLQPVRPPVLLRPQPERARRQLPGRWQRRPHLRASERPSPV